MNKKVIAVFTGNRAEYGLQLPVLRAIEAHEQLDYRLIVSGAHLDSDFGSTLREIREDGFEPHAEVRIDMDKDSLNATAQAIGSGVLSMSKVLEEMSPDMLVVYADRFEGFAAVIASSQMGIPTAHIEGGDLTEGGALDDSVRHAMTKLSHLHFTTNLQATNRIIAMGEEPWRVHTVGFPAIDLIEAGSVETSERLSARFELDYNRPIVLFTQHSVATEFEKAGEQIDQSLLALSRLAGEGIQVIITYPNNDAGGREIISRLEAFGDEGLENIQIYPSLGRYTYHGFLSLATNENVRFSCVGNSSSGIKETPVFGCPTVNIGSRQLGRLRAENVIDVDYDEHEIFSKIKFSLFDENFRRFSKFCTNPYGLGDAGDKIAKVLAGTVIDKKLIRKRMMLRGEMSEDGWCR